jgi:hypothetical protein
MYATVDEIVFFPYRLWVVYICETADRGLAGVTNSLNTEGVTVPFEAFT